MWLYAAGWCERHSSCRLCSAIRLWRIRCVATRPVAALAAPPEDAHASAKLAEVLAKRNDPQDHALGGASCVCSRHAPFVGQGVCAPLRPAATAASVQQAKASLLAAPWAAERVCFPLMHRASPRGPQPGICKGSGNHRRHERRIRSSDHRLFHRHAALAWPRLFLAPPPPCSPTGLNTQAQSRA